MQIIPKYMFSAAFKVAFTFLVKLKIFTFEAQFNIENALFGAFGVEIKFPFYSCKLSKNIYFQPH